MIAGVFVALLAGHFAGDYLAQTDWQANHKAGPLTVVDETTGRRTFPGVHAMFGHVWSYGWCQAAALTLAALAGQDLPGWWAVVAAMVVSLGTHAFIDRRWPVRWLLQHTRSAPFADLATAGMNGMALTDQALHIVCMYIAAVLAVWVG